MNTDFNVLKKIEIEKDDFSQMDFEDIFSYISKLSSLSNFFLQHANYEQVMPLQTYLSFNFANNLFSVPNSKRIIQILLKQHPSKGSKLK